MIEYRRAYSPGATWFFTANLAERKESRLLVERIDELRVAFHTVERDIPSASMVQRPFDAVLAKL